MVSQEFVTESIVADWDKSGKNTIADSITKFGDLYAYSPEKATNGYKKLLYELCWAVLHQHITPQKFSQAFLTKDKAFNDAQAVLSDVLWLLGLEIEAEVSKENKESYKKAFVALIKECMAQSLVKTETLKQRLEVEVLEEVGLLKSSVMFNKKIIRINTKETLTQQKFNLLREESEGFSKLITELNKGGLNSATIDSTVANVQSLIGYFDLDPNRVFDLVLESFEHNIQNLCFLQLISLFKPSSLPHILGFKFQYYQNPEVLEPTPKSLYVLAATLMKHKLLTLDDLYLHLSPSDDAAKAEYDTKVDEAIASSKKVGATALPTSVTPSDDASKTAAGNAETEPEKKVHNLTRKKRKSKDNTKREKKK